MKTVIIPKRSRTVHALLQEARDEDILVQAEDGSQFVLSAVDDFAQEIDAQRRNKKLMAFLDDRAKETESIPLAEVERRFGLRGSKPRKKRLSNTSRRKR